MRTIQKLIFGSFIILAAAGCGKINLYEKQVQIPSQQWYYDHIPQFTFEIEDTAALYHVYIVLRHTDMYNYNNIWLKVGVQAPGDSFQYKNINLKLASATEWEGTGMGDIFEVRKMISAGATRFNTKGDYTFTIKQIMRENPLEHIMNVGLRIEKVTGPQ